MLLRIQAVVLNNRQRILEAYINAGVNPNIVSAEHGMGSLLFLAAVSNYSDMVEFLFEKGAEPRRRQTSPAEWSILDEVGVYIDTEKAVEDWGKRCYHSLNAVNGLDIHHTLGDTCLLHYAAGIDNQQLHQPALDVAISSGITMNVGYLLDMGSKPTFYSLEDAIRICNTGRCGDRVKCPYGSGGWIAWKLIWVRYVQLIAIKLDLDSVEAASTIEKILRNESQSVQWEDTEDGSLYLPDLFRKMSRRSQSLYARRLEFRRYEVRLTVARRKLQELEDNLDRSKPSWWQTLDQRVPRDTSVCRKIIQEIEKAKGRDYVEEKVKGLEEILKLRHEAAVDLP
ncbi:hypothetical protein BO85DRAFT_501062 [Aspergillus piperis CBS 112811]|uniref:Ankyrin n=1 Tax=Aspergillus piperis CBS 112811 TaxID=1448313 RepID=A0A8G1R8W1_9EURO|nr:hypothetical protein BO85DRAFT_501062 [Aspergillus piperis CBS 112811]RAH61659.1 hypothetical protein BO85DRAFT_501062 [Aspergillus piperis CBS 112811]